MQIDLHIPTPDTINRGRGRAAKYPFAEMPVGGSFSLPDERGDRAILAAKMWKRRHPGWSYCSQKADGQVRVWRTA